MNAYGSKLDTFIGMDAYNLTTGFAPPADLALTGSDFSPRYFANRMSGSPLPVYGFSPQDKPFLRGLGFFSNFADGLVDASANHNQNMFDIRLTTERLGNALTGTIANTAGQAAVVGTNTLFTQECAVGMTIIWPDAGGALRVGTIAVITDDTHLDLLGASASTGMFTSNTVAGAVRPVVVSLGALDIQLPTLNSIYPFDFFLGDVSKIRTFTGKWTFRAGSTAVTGVNTRFTREVTAGQYVRYVDVNGTLRTSMVATVTDNNHLVLSAAAAANGIMDANSAAATVITLDSHLGVRAQLVADLALYTISIDPAYGGSRLAFHFVANIEHSRDLSQAFG